MSWGQILLVTSLAAGIALGCTEIKWLTDGERSKQAQHPEHSRLQALHETFMAAAGYLREEFGTEATAAGGSALFGCSAGSREPKVDPLGLL
jgi:hypothetical protein